jgi:hypothetical protein
MSECEIIAYRSFFKPMRTWNVNTKVCPICLGANKSQSNVIFWVSGYMMRAGKLWLECEMSTYQPLSLFWKHMDAHIWHQSLPYLCGCKYMLVKFIFWVQNDMQWVIYYICESLKQLECQILLHTLILQMKCWPYLATPYNTWLFIADGWLRSWLL